MPASTLGELRQSGYRPRSVKQEMRENLLARLKEGAPILPGIVGYEDSVVPALVNAILARHNFILLGLRGQAKSRILRQLVALLDDEIPVLAVAAACAEGRTEIRDAAELRVKETDRLAATAAFLTAMGADVEELEDGLVIEGGRPLRGTTVESHSDHRIAMAAAVAGLTATGETTIRGADCVAVSFPGFWDELDALAGATPSPLRHP